MLYFYLTIVPSANLPFCRNIGRAYTGEMCRFSCGICHSVSYICACYKPTTNSTSAKYLRCIGVSTACSIDRIINLFITFIHLSSSEQHICNISPASSPKASYRFDNCIRIVFTIPTPSPAPRNPSCIPFSIPPSPHQSPNFLFLTLPLHSRSISTILSSLRSKITSSKTTVLSL